MSQPQARSADDLGLMLSVLTAGLSKQHLQPLTFSNITLSDLVVGGLELCFSVIVLQLASFPGISYETP